MFELGGLGHVSKVMGLRGLMFNEREGGREGERERERERERKKKECVCVCLSE